MVICDALQLAFVHIPKCAGTTIRKALCPFDSHSEKLGEWFQYPDGGRRSMHHMPLADVRRYLPDIYDRIARYDSYAIVREPRDRFSSAFLQHLRSFQKIELSSADRAPFLQKTLEICDKLDMPSAHSAPELMHFLRQSNFITVDGRAIVCKLHPFEDLPRFAADLKAHHGVFLDLTAPYNQAHLRSGEVGRALKAIARLAHRLFLSSTSYRRMRGALRIAMGTSPSRLYRGLFEDDRICSFVDRFYAEDISLHRRLRMSGGSTP